MFVVAGITGNTGSAAAEALLAKGHTLRALTRDPAKVGAWSKRGVEVAVTELTDAAGLARAFEGADGAYLLAPPDLQHPDPVGLYARTAEAVRDAVKASGLPRLVFLSSEGAHLPAGTGPVRGLHAAEGILAGAAPQTTFLRASMFMQNWRPLLGLAREQGILPTFLADTARRTPSVSTQDIGAQAAVLLQEASPPPIVELHGPRPISAADVAEAFAGALGRAVVPVQPPREAWDGILQQSGLGPAYASLVAEMYESGINTGLMHFEGSADQRRGRTDIADAVKTWLAG